LGKAISCGEEGLQAISPVLRMQSEGVRRLDQMSDSLSDFYRLPIEWQHVLDSPQNGGAQGFFRFGTTVCFGRCEAGVADDVTQSAALDASRDLKVEDSVVRLPFSFREVMDNFLHERYQEFPAPVQQQIFNHDLIRKSYYGIRKFLPVAVRRHLQRMYFNDWRKRKFPSWPVDFSADSLREEILRLSMEAAGVTRVPFIWFWPNGALSSLIVTHDVETKAGVDFTSELMDIDTSYGFRSSFQVIPEGRYAVTDDYVQEIRDRGFEFNIHDLNHDGRLYREREEFLRRAKKINEYVQKYKARGFRAGAMYRNADWYSSYEFSYDMSVPNVAHFEPKRGGCCTVLPFFIGKMVELPLTAAQDYTLFHILNDYSIGLWQQQIDLVRKRNGLISFITHPDYLIESRARSVYESLLDHLRKMVSTEKVWAALPGEVDRWWRARSAMRLVQTEGGWKIEGPESGRACVAYAVLDGGRFRYELDTASSASNLHEMTPSVEAAVPRGVPRRQ
jgi:hypothetical protein